MKHKNMKLLFMQPSPASYHFLHHKSKCSPHPMFPKTHNLSSSLSTKKLQFCIFYSLSF